MHPGKTRDELAICVSDKQTAPQVFDVLMENQAQFRKDLLNLQVIVCRESLSTQERDSFLESHGGNGAPKRAYPDYSRLCGKSIGYDLYLSLWATGAEEKDGTIVRAGMWTPRHRR